MPRFKPAVRKLLKWFHENARDLPWRRDPNPYAIWISEIMLQQTQVATMIPYWRRWMSRFPTVQSLAKARAETILRLWAGLGYYSRAKNLRLAAKIVVNEHQGIFPKRFTDVLRLPGVGRYTAGAICSIAFNQPTPVVDGNVSRVLSRFLGVRSDPRHPPNKERLWTFAGRLVETASTLDSNGSQNCSNLNQSLMELGALVCTPRRPKCDACPLRNTCIANRQGLSDHIPARAIRPKPRRRHFVAFALHDRGAFLIRKRFGTRINADLWEFPNAEFAGTNKSIERAARSCLGLKPPKLRKLAAINHTITQSRIRLDVYEGTIGRQSISSSGRSLWLPLAKLRGLPFPSAHRKISLILEKQRSKTA